jgi:preprotein translocase subunit SecA
VQREHHYVIVDEADSILIDEARTPLVISTATRKATPEEQAVYRWADQLARRLVVQTHFRVDPRTQLVELTGAGRQEVRWSHPPTGPHAQALDRLYEHVERALQAHQRFRRDQHYLVENEQVVIIDEFTGRRMPDRHWREGLHQAVEAKEEVPVTLAADHAAQITFQSHFRLYRQLAGMTGTAAPNARELRHLYRLQVVPVPTRRPLLRRQEPDRIFGTEEEKFAALVQEVRRQVAQGRPVLIGTRSVTGSERLAARLRAAGLDPQVLNARHHEAEAQIIARAGEPGRVTIATNMAGRGTDIQLAPGVADRGGLCVLGTERHEAHRIDRQLAGRAGRQGDPGSCQFFLCLEDELLEALGPATQERLRQLGRGGGRNWDRQRRLFRQAQRLMERRHYRQRLDVLTHEKQRQEVLKELGADPYVD